MSVEKSRRFHIFQIKTIELCVTDTVKWVYAAVHKNYSTILNNSKMQVNCNLFLWNEQKSVFIKTHKSILFYIENRIINKQQQKNVQTADFIKKGLILRFFFFHSCCCHYKTGFILCYLNNSIHLIPYHHVADDEMIRDIRTKGYVLLMVSFSVSRCSRATWCPHSLYQQLVCPAESSCLLGNATPGVHVDTVKNRYNRSWVS